MAHLGEIYIRLRPYEVDEQHLNRLGHATDELVRVVAQQHYREPVEIGTLLEEGTLRAHVSVIGALLGAYYFVGNYDGFKNGVSSIYNDTRRFGQEVVEGFTAAAGAKPTQIEQTQIRYKTPGQLKIFLDEVERMERLAALGKKAELERELMRSSERLRKIEKDLSEEEKTSLHQVLKLKHLPPPDQWPQPMVIEHGPPRHIRDSQRSKAGPTREVRRRLKYQNTLFVGFDRNGEPQHGNLQSSERPTGIPEGH